MYPLHDIYDAASELAAKLHAPTGSISINSFLGTSGETIIVVHVRPQFKYLTSRIPSRWMGFEVEFDIAELPSMNEQSTAASTAYHAH
ncbi:hypothetical protein D9M69_663980 [compost metagenome]